MKEIPINKAISITTYNIGYCSLGKEESFFIEGGKHIFPKSKQSVKNNLVNIKTQLKSLNSDVYLIQEIPKKFILTRGVKIYKNMISIFKNHKTRYCNEFNKAIHKLLLINFGKLTASKFKIENSQIINLNSKKLSLERNFSALITEHNIEDSNKKLIIGNIHIQAFDKTAKAKNLQLKTLYKFLEAHNKKGNHIIIGGDWNLILKDITLPHTINKKYLTWVHKFPINTLPKSLQIISDKMPTVRNMSQPYIKNENFESIIDGFITSKNIEIVSCNTSELGFESSDHNPVTIKVKLKK